MANYAVGDIQGCYKEFEKGLKKIKFNQEKDYLWLTGDLINRGPDSLKTLEKIYELRSRVHMVLGNHDLHFLARYYSNRKKQKNRTRIDEPMYFFGISLRLFWYKNMEHICLNFQNFFYPAHLYIFQMKIFF